MVEVKQALTEAVLWPLTYPDTFARLGVEPPRGVLLYGPPGCGKTFLVRAMAGTGQANVLSVKGAELLTKWVGESERAVRELFRRAREAAPTLVFLDEVDALAPVRGQSTDGGTADRVVAALLTELDGVESLRDVVVIGATNRPDLVDPALLRPGRLDRLVYVPPPDAAARAEILRAAAKRTPLGPDVDLAALAAETEGFSARTAPRWSARRRWRRCASRWRRRGHRGRRGGGPARGPPVAGPGPGRRPGRLRRPPPTRLDPRRPPPSPPPQLRRLGRRESQPQELGLGLSSGHRERLRKPPPVEAEIRRSRRRAPRARPGRGQGDARDAPLQWVEHYAARVGAQASRT